MTAMGRTAPHPTRRGSPPILGHIHPPTPGPHTPHPSTPRCRRRSLLGAKPGKPAKASTDTSSSNTSTDTSIDPSILDDVPACNLVRRRRMPTGATAMRRRIRGACLDGWHAQPA